MDAALIGRGRDLIARQLRRASKQFAIGGAGTVLFAAMTIISSYVVGWITDDVLAARQEAARTGNSEHEAERVYYPPQIGEPYLARRRKVGDIDLLYGESRLIVKGMKDEGVLCILCVRRINVPLLNLTADSAVNKLREQIKQGVKPGNGSAARSEMLMVLSRVTPTSGTKERS